MIRSLYYSLKIDTYYAVNSFIYFIKKLPIFNDLVTEDTYKSSLLKNVIGVIGLILSLGRAVLFKFLYYFVVVLLANVISKNSMSFYHVLFFFSLLGLFINNKLLNVSMKKYLCIILFNIDSKKYLLSNLYFSLIINSIINSICLFTFGPNNTLNIIFVILLLLFRIIGEAFNINYYKRHEDFWYNNYLLYFSILIPLFLCSFSPFIGLIINKDIVMISLIISSIISIISFVYIISINNYKTLYKRINTISNVLNNKDDTRISNVVDVRNKDIKIDESILKNKKGYDYFNTIFFERHRSILLSSSKNYSLVILAVYVLFIILCISSKDISNSINNFFNTRMSWFVLIMYFINRGSIVTQAMFYNCDHAMLKYNFYRDPKVIVGLFKMRLKTLIRVNILPSLVMSIGNLILLYLTKDTNILNYIGSFLFVNILSIFFSVHYLVVYYLLQPYDSNMQIKKASYSVVNLVVYFVCYTISDLVIPSVTFSLIGLLFSIIYIVVGLKLVEKYAPVTFKIN